MGFQRPRVAAVPGEPRLAGNWQVTGRSMVLRNDGPRMQKTGKQAWPDFMKRTIALAFIAVLASRAVHAETRCGWLSNPSMGLWELYDAGGLWTIRSNAIHHEAKGMDKIPDISTGEYVHTFASHGYACACMDVVTEPEIVLEIRSVRQLPLATCERDPAIQYFLDKDG